MNSVSCFTMFFTSLTECVICLQVEELMGNVSNAAVAYAKAGALLYFLVVEAAALPLQPPLLLSPIDRYHLPFYPNYI